LEKHNFFTVQNAGDGADEFFDVVVALDAVRTLATLQSKSQKKQEFFLIHVRKFEGLLIENNHFSSLQLEFVYSDEKIDLVGFQFKPRTYWTGLMLLQNSLDIRNNILFGFTSRNVTF
jgi:hypothetical protein